MIYSGEEVSTAVLMQLTIFYYAPQRWYYWSCGVELPMLVAIIVFMGMEA
jgi:hypothetical protein